MKNLLFSLLLLTTAAHAQFQLGLNGGIGFNTAPSVSGLYEVSGIKGSDISPAVSLQALYVRHNWQYGFSADYAQLSYKSYQIPPIVFLGPIYYSLNRPRTTIKIADPAVSAKLFVHKQLVFRRLETYGGISAGYVSLFRSRYPVGYESLQTSAGSAWQAGLQVGGTQFISKHLGINAEVSATYMSLGVSNVHYTLWYIPCTLGIRYKL